MELIRRSRIGNNLESLQIETRSAHLEDGRPTKPTWPMAV